MNPANTLRARCRALLAACKCGALLAACKCGALLAACKCGALLAACGLLLGTGCTPSAPIAPAMSAPDPKDHGHDGHDHPEHGPHGGDLIELGSEEYHLELVHDDTAGTVTFFVLDGTAKKAVPIEAPTLLVQAKKDGKPLRIEVAAARQDDDPAGKSSRFTTTKESGLGELLDLDGAEPKVAVSIAGNSYVGKIVHDHGKLAH